jgi:pimeloyl-ACP methyl ester carboxylesterase
MAPLAWALAAAGHRVVAIDLPAHGRSNGRHTTLPEVVEVLRDVAEEIGPVAGLVGHSFGAVAIMAAASVLTPAKLVTIGCPSTLRFVIDSFAVALGLEGRARARFMSALEGRFGAEMWRQFSPQRLVARLAAPALVIHDADDATVPHAHAQTLTAASSGARQLTTSGLGHYRVLRSSEVHRGILAFLNPGANHESAH